MATPPQTDPPGEPPHLPSLHRGMALAHTMMEDAAARALKPPHERAPDHRPQAYLQFSRAFACIRHGVALEIRMIAAAARHAAKAPKPTGFYALSDQQRAELMAHSHTRVVWLAIDATADPIEAKQALYLRLCEASRLPVNTFLAGLPDPAQPRNQAAAAAAKAAAAQAGGDAPPDAPPEHEPPDDEGDIPSAEFFKRRPPGGVSAWVEEECARRRAEQAGG